VRVSLNTDDPSLLGASLEGEYALCAGAYDWSTREVRAIAATSIDASFASEDVKRSLRDDLQRW
jgi:adenosine deaminase